MKDTCPYCLGPIQNLSDDPAFVNKNPRKVNLLKLEESKDSKRKVLNLESANKKKGRPCTKCKKWIIWSDHWCNNCGSPQ